ncbi:MAG: hypothetical protein AMXMBFR81_16290 [Chthonomonas sp.]
MVKPDIVRELEANVGFPAVSILLETHRTSPDNQRDPIALKNLVTEAEVRLAEVLDKRQAEPLVIRLRDLAASIDHEHNTEGLGLFVSPAYMRAVRFPYRVPTRVQVDETFAVRDLIRAHLQSPHYWVLVLSEKPSRLFLATRDQADEVTRFGFPMTHTGPGGEAPLPGGFGVNPSAVRDAHRREFVRRVLKGLGEANALEALPVLVTGTQDFLADLDVVSPKVEDLLATIGGSYDHLSAHDVGRLAWPVAEQAFVSHRSLALKEVAVAVGAGKCASGLPQVYAAVREGRGHLLVVEEGYIESGAIDPESGALTLQEASEKGTQDDVVDLVIHEAIERGGRVVFVPPGSLAVHQRIALVLRY